MFYTIYKITNKLDGKVYIGKHQTKDMNDGYMGSGKHLKRAIEKYGTDNFEKEILFQFDNEADMNAKEAELVTEDFVKEDTNYNLCPGGNGGFGYINNNTKLIEKRTKTRSSNIEWKKKASETGIKNLLDPSNRKKAMRVHKSLFPNGTKGFSDRTHSIESKLKISQAAKNRTTNSQTGTMWITNGKENKKIKKDIDIIPEGWYKGRVLMH